MPAPTQEEQLAMFDKWVAEARALFIVKNNQYGSAWYDNLPTTNIDRAREKVMRIRNILANNVNAGSESVRETLMDISIQAFLTAMQLEVDAKSPLLLLQNIAYDMSAEEADSFMDAAMADAAAERTDMRNELAQITDDEMPSPTKRERQIEIAKQIFDCTYKSLEYNERGFWDIYALSPCFINREHFSYVERNGSLASPDPTPQLIQAYFDLGCPHYLNLK